MRVARKKSLGGKRPRVLRKSHPLVLASYEIREDGTHVLTVPVHTYNPNNGQTGNSRKAGVFKTNARKAQRAMVGIYLNLNSVPRHFRGVRLVRLAPSTGLDTGGLWAALKAPQDEVAKHLGVDDGPDSPASWDMDQEHSEGYGVRVELRVERQESALARLREERLRVWAVLNAAPCYCDARIDMECVVCRIAEAFSTNSSGELVQL